MGPLMNCVILLIQTSIMTGRGTVIKWAGMKIGEEIHTLMPILSCQMVLS